MVDDEKVSQEHAELERWLAGLALPTPPAWLVDAVKTRVRVELGERWLEGVRHPTPTRRTVARVRESIRRELGTVRPGRAQRRWADSQAFGALAAAAAILLAVGIGWWASIAARPSENLIAVDALINTLEAETEADLRIASLGEAVDNVEADLWDSDDDSEESLDQLESLDAELDELERETENVLGAS